MTPDRVAEALAALEAAEKEAVVVSALRRVAKQGIELRDAIVEYFVPAPPTEHFFEDVAVFGELLGELADAVLGLEPGQ